MNISELVQIKYNQFTQQFADLVEDRQDEEAGLVCVSVDGGDQCGGPEVVQGGERSGLRPGTVRDTPSHRHSQEEQDLIQYTSHTYSQSGAVLDI